MIMNSDLIVTIRCLTYNHEPYIRQCLDGFVIQKTNFRFEAIVHDDASTDGTTAIIKEYARKYPDIIKPIFEKENQYSKGGRILEDIMDKHSYGKYVAVCEGDDYWTDPYKLQKQVDILNAHPECTISFCRVQKIDKEGKRVLGTIPKGNQIREGVLALSDFTHEEFYHGHWTFHTSSFLIKKEMFFQGKDRIDFFSRFPYGDMPMILWSLIHGNGYFIDNNCSCYRVMSGGYNSRVSNDSNLAIRQDEILIDSLKFVDSYTNFKYHDDIKIRILVAQYHVESSQRNNLLIIFAPKYWKVAWHFGIKGVISVVLRSISPSLTRIIKLVLK